MSLRTRIAVTFLLLLAAVLAAALGAVSAANRSNAAREGAHQLSIGASVFSSYLEGNRRLLKQAATTVAADYGFRETLAQHDTATLVSVLENAGQRIGARLVVLSSLDGHVMAASGAHVETGAAFKTSTAGGSHIMLDAGRIFQLVSVDVKSPLPVARLAMGFELDREAVLELVKITGLDVTLSVHTGDVWEDAVSTALPGAARRDDVMQRRIEMSDPGDGTQVVATLSRPLAEVRAPFERLTNLLYVIAALSLLSFAWAAFLIARNITRPLHELTQSVDQIRNGTYDGTFRLQRGDELGMLAEGLQLMQTAVQSRDNSIRQLAYQDTLTGLMNRTSFSVALSQRLIDAAGLRVGIAVINLHRFRRINEHLGYSVGDAVLMRIAQRLTALPSINSAVARLAADQFAAFTTLQNGDDLHTWGLSMLMALAEPVNVEAQPIDISATLGLAVSSGLALSADDLLRCADLALENARREKRPLAVYAATLKPAARDQLSLLGELRRAVELDELRLFFQPKIELATGRVAGAEVLVRWEHPTRGLLNPVAFIPFAEQTGFIRRMTRWMLEHAIAQGAEWHRAGRPLMLAVNISADDIADPRLDSRVAGALTRHQLPPALLTLELTESGFIADPTRALGVLDALSALGVYLSIDDFGTGYSSLSLLARMPVNEIKIDRSFVQGLETDAEFATVVKSAIDMGHGLGLKVVAEGIETEAAAKRLLDLGCDIAQGYFYARPMPAADLLRWLEGKVRIPIIAVPVNFKIEDVGDTLSLATY